MPKIVHSLAKWPNYTLEGVIVIKRALYGSAPNLKIYIKAAVNWLEAAETWLIAALGFLIY